MKKIMSGIMVALRILMLISPGVVSGMWFIPSHGWTVGLLAAIGVEAMCLFAASLVCILADVTRRVQEEEKKTAADE